MSTIVNVSVSGSSPNIILFNPGTPGNPAALPTIAVDGAFLKLTSNFVSGVGAFLPSTAVTGDIFLISDSRTVFTKINSGDVVTGSPFKSYNFTPFVSSPSVFVADDATSVVTPTTLTSTNVSPPTLAPFGANFAMMSTVATSGSMDLIPPTGGFYGTLVFHDGTLNESNIGNAFTNPTLPALGALVIVFNDGTNGNIQVIAGGVPVSGLLASPLTTTITLSGTHLTTELGTVALNSTAFSHCSVLIFNPSSPTATIPVFTYSNNLVGLANTPIPVDSNDGDALVIQGLGSGGAPSSATVLGSVVLNGDYCVLLSSKTMIKVFRDINVEDSIISSLNNGALRIVAQNEDYTLVPNDNNLITPSKPVIDTTIMCTLNSTPVNGNYVNVFFYEIPNGFKKGRITVINQTRGKVVPLFISDLMIGGGVLLSSGTYSGKYSLSGVGQVGLEVAPFTSRTFDIVATGSVMSIIGLSGVSCSLSIPSNTTSSCIQATPSTNNVPMAVGASVLSFKSLFDRTKARSGMRLRLTAADNATLPVNVFNDGVANTNVQDYFLTDADITNGYAIVTANPTAVSANLTNTAHSLYLSIDSVLAYQQPASSINYNNGKGLDDYTATDFVAYTVTVS